MSNKKHIFITYPIVLACIALDQITKLIFSTQQYKQQPVVLLPKVLSIFSTSNDGAAWGVLSGKIWLLIVLSIAFIIGFIIFSYKFKDKTSFYTVSYAFILGGALGNLIDRVLFASVRDFIKLEFLKNFPIFNLADSFLVVGVAMFCIFVLFIYPKTEQKNQKDQKK